MAVRCNPGCHATTYPGARTFSLSLVNTLHIVFTQPTVRTIQYTDKDTVAGYIGGRPTITIMTNKTRRTLSSLLQTSVWLPEWKDILSKNLRVLLRRWQHVSVSSPSFYTVFDEDVYQHEACMQDECEVRVRSKITTLPANNLIGRSVTPLSGQGAVINTVAFMQTEGWKKNVYKGMWKYQSVWNIRVNDGVASPCVCSLCVRITVDSIFVVFGHFTRNGPHRF